MAFNPVFVCDWFSGHVGVVEILRYGFICFYRFEKLVQVWDTDFSAFGTNEDCLYFNDGDDYYQT